MVRLLPLFVYGTARVGQSLHSVIEPAVADSALAQAPGMELMVPVNTIASFPYLVRTTDRTKKVWGDLLMVDRGRELMQLAGIESLAGYSLEGIRVDHGVEGFPDFALAFVWNRTERPLQPWGSPSWLSRNLTSTR